MTGRRRFEHDSIISGIGQSAVGRRLGRSPVDLTVEAALAAIGDAGLTRDDIDGIATYPGAMDQPPGFSGAGVNDVQDALRLNLNWFTGSMESPGQLGSVIVHEFRKTCDVTAFDRAAVDVTSLQAVD